MSSPEAPAVRPGSRAIARAAVQAELSLAAYELVVEKGYGNVTLDDMAAAGGVSRSTFLRYFRTKDQAIVVALKAYVERMADALRARPRDEDDWSALRSAIEAFVVPIYRKNPAGAQAFTRLCHVHPGAVRRPARTAGLAHAADPRAGRAARCHRAGADRPGGQGRRRAGVHGPGRLLLGRRRGRGRPGGPAQGGLRRAQRRGQPGRAARG